jgi:hypothetical protein
MTKTKKETVMSMSNRDVLKQLSGLKKVQSDRPCRVTFIDANGLRLSVIVQGIAKVDALATLPSNLMDDSDVVLLGELERT